MRHNYVIMDKQHRESIEHSKVLRVGKLLFITRELPYDLERGVMITEDFAKAASLCIQNLCTDVVSQGTTVDNIVSTTVYVSNREHISTVDELFDFYFKGNPPGKKIVEGKLRMNVPIEIDAVAIVR